MNELLVQLPDLLGAHVLISLVALGAGAVMSIPLAVLLVRVEALRGPVLGVVAVIQTIPSLALLALMVPALVLVNSVVGGGLPVLGFLPTVAALTLYSMLPMMRNTVTGIAGVDPALTEAARALGMTDRQTLVQVELPLAAPVIFAGIRTAAVWVVGMATLATPVGQPCLGNYIFAGLQIRDWGMVVFGCIVAAVLAVLLDVVLAQLERGRWAASGVVVLLFAGAFVQQSGSDGDDVVVIGAKNFTEQYILADVLKRRIDGPTQIRAGLGSTIVFDALSAGEIDVYVEYTGTIWATHMGRTDALDPAALDAFLVDRGIVNVGALGFDNAYALAVRGDHPARSIRDLSAFTIGADYEFLQRTEWRSVRDHYGLEPSSQKSYDPTFLYQAVVNREVDVISAFSSDGRIAAFDLRVLDDPDGVLPPYDAVLLVSEQAPHGLVEQLRSLVGAISIDAMRKANQRVDLDRKPVSEAAAQLLRP